MTNDQTVTQTFNDEDMANVGRSVMECIADVTREGGAMAGWAPMDDPAEIIHDMANEIDELRSRTAHSGEGRSNGAGEDGAYAFAARIAKEVVPEDADGYAVEGEVERLREALAKQTFLTCVSGDGPTPYLKVHFKNLSDAHAAQDELLGRKS